MFTQIAKKRKHPEDCRYPYVLYQSEDQIMSDPDAHTKQRKGGTLQCNTNIWAKSPNNPKNFTVHTTKKPT